MASSFAHIPNGVKFPSLGGGRVGWGEKGGCIVQGNASKIIHWYTIALDKVLFFNQKVSTFFLFLDKNIRCGYSLEAPHLNDVLLMSTHNVFFLRNKKSIYLMPTLIQTFVP